MAAYDVTVNGTDITVTLSGVGAQGIKGDTGDTGDITQELQDLHDETEGYKNNAATSATAASTSATSAATSATASATSASAASTSASAASSSASAASTSASTASTQASNASTSATNAANSATAAATSATNAATSESNAAASAALTLATLDAFDDRYLGSKTSDPTVDNDGNALVAGALYYNSVSTSMKVYSGSAWDVVPGVSTFNSRSGAVTLLASDVNGAFTSSNMTLGQDLTVGWDIKMSNAFYLKGRNAANTTDIPLIKASASDKVEIDSSGYGAVFGGVIVVNGSASSLIGLASAGTNRGYLYADAATLQVAVETGMTMQFMKAGVEMSRFDTSGNLLVGLTARSGLPALGSNTKLSVRGAGSNSAASLGSAQGAGTIDLGIGINAYETGAAMMLIASRNTSDGTSTEAAMYLVRFYYNGNNTPTVTYIGGSSNFISAFGVSGSNTFTCTDSSGGNVSYAWMINKA